MLLKFRVLILLLSGLLSLSVLQAQTTQTLTYTADTSNFPNPERGFYVQDAPLWLAEERNPQEVAVLRSYRQNGISLVRWYFLIDEFREQPLTAEVLEYIREQFDAAREAGIKVIPRFAYNFPMGGEYPFQDPDATLEQVLAHMEQLAPILQHHADVIALMEIGFVGAWGEWHSSTHNLVGEGEINDNSRAIMDRLLAVLPPERMVVLRYAPYKQAIYGSTPLDETQAFSATPQARIGSHNDCFLASATDWGSYPEESAPRQAIQNYLHLETRFVPQEGETCNDDAEAQPFIGCENALAQLAYFHYSALNSSYHEGVLQSWQDNGCYGEIERRLGYRLRLLEATFPSTLATNQPFKMQLKLVNEGFASPYNPRGFAILLRSHANGLVYPTSLAATPDPRFWLPENGTIQLDLAVTPATLPDGDYDLLLFLPDPMPSLADRPDYALRFANTELWENETGYHVLGQVTKED